MRFVGIDVAAERHVVAAVDDTHATTLKPTPFTEDAEGDQQLRARLGPAADTRVAREATGHYGKTLFAALVADGFTVALLNPLRTHRFAGEALERTQTDAIDARGIARFAAQRTPVLTAVRKNPWLRAYYAGLIARGKLPKVTLIAAMRTLLHAVYSVATHRRLFLPQLVTEEARP